ncbi:hypothetical protein [Chamaesiphon sp.]|uniref:hypothetical protein n=1 Tax=Chamaesiphon sp. TaxID=2814140 RepID=UPI003593951D
MELYVTVDLGSSLIKVLYANDTSGLPQYLAIEPEIIEVPESCLRDFRRNDFQGHAEDHAFVGFDSRYYAVGRLARRKFKSTTDLALLKSNYAVQRILTAVSIAVEKLGMGRKVKLFLYCLLPPGELKDRDILDRDLTTALASFDTPIGKLQAKLMYFSCHPEGGGLAMHYQKCFPECRDRVLGIVMMGHRNVSTYLVDRGVPATYKSSDLGFVSMVREIQSNTSGYSEYDITRSVARYLLAEISESASNPKYLYDLLLKTKDVDRKQELEQLVDTIESAKKMYWRSISQWLNTQLSEVTDILIGGGTCRIFTKEFRGYTWNLPKIIGKPESRSFLNAGLAYGECTLIPSELRDRYADAQCLWDSGLMPVVREYQGRKQVSKK